MTREDADALALRMARAEQKLLDLAHNTDDASLRSHYESKAQGVGLALSYLEEELRHGGAS